VRRLNRRAVGCPSPGTPGAGVPGGRGCGRHRTRGWPKGRTRVPARLAARIGRCNPRRRS